MPVRGQFFNPLVIPGTRTIDLLIFRRKLCCQVDVAQSLDLMFQHAAEKNHPRDLAREVWVTVDLLHSAKEFLQRLLCRRTSDSFRRC